MDALNTFLSLLARTEGRDKVLRLIQYACLHSVEDQAKGSTHKVYEQMRMTRKLLRFLRTLEFSTKIKEQFPKLKTSLSSPPHFLKYLTILYFLSDHRVCLGELGVIDKNHVAINYPRSMKFYFLQNFFGVINNLIKMSLEILKGKMREVGQGADNLKKFAFDLIRCLLDCLVALYYWKRSIPAKKAGLIGVITSIMAILQSLGYI